MKSIRILMAATNREMIHTYVAYHLFIVYSFHICYLHGISKPTCVLFSKLCSIRAGSEGFQIRIDFYIIATQMHVENTELSTKTYTRM